MDKRTRLIDLLPFALVTTLGMQSLRVLLPLFQQYLRDSVGIWISGVPEPCAMTRRLTLGFALTCPCYLNQTTGAGQILFGRSYFWV
jgi:hypothetical protein